MEHPSHAYLLAGPAHTGKRTAARAFAQALLCDTPERTGEGPDACGACRACRLIAAGSHPDVREWDVPEGEKTFKVDQVRELIAAVSCKPFSAKRQVHILAALDAIHPTGANALLKTLEEPPLTSLLILLSADLDGLLPTLRSRCQIVRFGLTPPEQLVALLRERGAEDVTRARTVALNSEGRIGLALTRLSESPNPVLPSAPWPEAHLSGYMTWADALAARPPEEQTAALDSLLGQLRDLALLAAQPDISAERLRASDARESLRHQAASAPVTTWLQMAQEVEQAREALRRHANARLVFDALGQRLLAQPPV